MKIRRKIFTILLFMGFFLDILASSVFGSSQTTTPSVPSTFKETVLVNENLISVRPTFLEVGGKRTNINTTGGIYTTPSGGQIKVVRAPSLYINKDNVEFKQIGLESDGSTCAIFKAVLPIEFDYSIYTIFLTPNVNPTGKSFSVSDTSENQICVGRVYKGDSNDDDNFWNPYDVIIQDAGWGVGSYDTPYGQIVLQKGAKKWNYRTDERPIKEREYLGNKDKYGNDGWDSFQSREATEVFYANIPYLKMGDVQYDGYNIEQETIQKQKSALTAYAQSSSVDIGNFNIIWDLNIQALRGVRNMISLNTDGTARLTLKKTYVHIADAMTLSGSTGTNYDEKGLIETATTGTITTVTKTDTTKASADQLGTKMPTTYTTPKGIVAIASPAQSVISTLVDPTTSSWGCDYPQPDLGLFSKDKNKDIDSFTDTEMSAIFNYTQWEVRANGYRLSPRVDVYEKKSTVNYYEAWVDNGYDLVGLTKSENVATDILTLGKVDVKNAFIKQRVRINMEIYSVYNISIDQAKDASTLSKLTNPTSPVQQENIKLTDYGTSSFSESFSAPSNYIDDFFNKLLGDYSWIIYAVIGLVGVILVFYIIGKVGSLAKSGSGQKERVQYIQVPSYPQYTPPPQYPPQPYQPFPQYPPPSSTYPPYQPIGFDNGNPKK